MSKLNRFKEYVIAPGETILELLEVNCMSQLDLADKTGVNKKTINEIIKGKAPITTATALKLEYVFNIPASFPEFTLSFSLSGIILVITLFTLAIRQDVNAKQDKVTKSIFLEIKTTTKIINTKATLYNTSHNVTKFLIFLFKLTATIVPITASIGKNKVSKIDNQSSVSYNESKISGVQTVKPSFIKLLITAKTAKTTMKKPKLLILSLLVFVFFCSISIFK